MIDLGIDILFVAIGVALCLCLYFRRPQWCENGKLADDDRTWENYIDDIRAMNTYNGIFFGIITIFLGIVIGNDQKILPISAIFLFMLAFVSASYGIFFFPIHKRKIPNTEPPRYHMKELRTVWFRTLIASQFTVVFTVCGVLSVLVGRMW